MYGRTLQRTRRPFTGAWIETIMIGMLVMQGMVAPSRGRGLKPCLPGLPGLPDRVAPSRGRGLKLPRQIPAPPFRAVAPSRGRGLKHMSASRSAERMTGRPFTGAWIETPPMDAAAGLWVSPLHGGVD